MTWRTRISLALIALAGAATWARADSIILRATAQAAANAPLTLGGIADLDGDEAKALASLSLVEEPGARARGSTWIEITAAEVREALAEAGAPLSRLSISGGVCTIRLARVAAKPVVDQAEPRGETPSKSIVDDQSGATIRSQVAASIARLLGAEQRDVRLLFDRSDESFLSETTWGRRIAVQPATNGSSSTIVVEVRVFSGTDATLLERRRLRVEAEVRRHVVIMTDARRRRQTIRAGDVERRELWMEVDGSAPVESIDEAIGAVARRRIGAGEILRTSDLEPPVLIERGQMVTVHCLRQGFAVRSRARAQGDGRLGEMIELSLEGSRKTFYARVNGPGEAVMDLDSMGIAPQRERSEP